MQGISRKDDRNPRASTATSLKSFRFAPVRIILLMSCTAGFLQLLYWVRTSNLQTDKRNGSAIAMMALVDILIAGIAWDMLLNLIYFVFLSEPLLRKKGHLFKNRALIRRILFGNQNAVEGLLEDLEESIRGQSQSYITRAEAADILNSLQVNYWRMCMFQGQVVVFRTWEPIIVSLIMLASLIVSSIELKLDEIKYIESLQYIEFVTITALITVNIAPLFMNIGTTSQIGFYKISISKTNAMFSAISAIEGKGVFKYKNDSNSGDHFTEELEGVSTLVRINYLDVPKNWIQGEEEASTVY